MLKKKEERVKNISVVKMPVSCIVRGCDFRKGKGIERVSFHTLPSDQNQREKLLTILNDWVGIRNAKHSKGEITSICGLYFAPECFKKGTTKLKKRPCQLFLPVQFL